MELRRVTGIYKIQSRLKPERIYIGSAKNISQRWYYHLQGLKNGCHGNGKLQNHCNKYGVTDLQFSLLLGCNKEDLLKIEQYFIDSYNPWFNICKTSNSQLGTKRTDEQRKRMSDAHKGVKHSEEQKKKIGDAHRGRERPKISEETRKKMSEASKLRKGALGKHWKLSPEQCLTRSNSMKVIWKNRRAS